MDFFKGKWLPRAKMCCVLWLLHPAVSNVVHKGDGTREALARLRIETEGTVKSGEAWVLAGLEKPSAPDPK